MKPKVYVARQPILDKYNMVVGYELLYRSSSTNRYDPETDAEVATRTVVANVVGEFGLRQLTNDRRAFVNFPKTLLMSAFPFLLNPRDYVIELLESITYDPPVIERLRGLSEKHYIMALDDYVGEGVPDEVFRYVDIIKVDFKLTSREMRQRIAARFLGEKQLLAEKLETEEDFQEAKADGYTLFQGYYFARPVMMEKSSVEVAAATYMRLWRETAKPYFSYDTLCSIIRSDVNLTYKFLLKINTMQYYRRHRVSALKPALIRLGVNEIRRWVLVLLLRHVSSSHGSEVPAKIAMSRGMFCEKITWKIGLSEMAEGAYIVGLFSMIDTILNQEFQEILRQLGLALQIEDALIKKKGILAEILEFTKQYEVGNWDAVDAFMDLYKLNREHISKIYVESVAESDLTFNEESGALPTSMLRL